MKHAWMYERRGIWLFFFAPWLAKRWHRANLEFLEAEQQAKLTVMDAELIVAVEAAKLGWPR